MTTETPTEPRPLTDRQREVLDFIKANIGFYGPTVREIAAALSITSPNGVVCHLDALQRKGWIKRESNKARAIEVIHVE
jgi:repressor LexA